MILGISGSPRSNGITANGVKKSLLAAMEKQSISLLQENRSVVVLAVSAAQKITSALCKMIFPQ